MHAKSALLLLAAAPLALMAGRAMAQMVDVPAVAENFKIVTMVSVVEALGWAD